MDSYHRFVSCALKYDFIIVAAIVYFLLCLFTECETLSKIDIDDDFILAVFVIA